jgi:NAD(P)-dependent dehydrogenase (short-subunit alcohol dehydrogenase family)
MSRLDNKVAIITEAASGMGRATAIRFAGEGAAVVVADLNQEGGESTVRECREQGGNAVFQKADGVSALFRLYGRYLKPLAPPDALHPLALTEPSALSRRSQIFDLPSTRSIRILMSQLRGLITHL